MIAFTIRRAVIATAAATLVVGASVLDAQDVVEIRLRGRYFPEPATVRITVAVAPDEQNRRLVIEADGERMFRSSEFQLDGDRSKRIHTVEFKNLVSGHYVVRAEVRSTGAVLGMAEEPLEVVGTPLDLR